VSIRLAQLRKERLLLQREGQSEREAPDREGRKRGGIDGEEIISIKEVCWFFPITRAKKPNRYQQDSQTTKT